MESQREKSSDMPRNIRIAAVAVVLALAVVGGVADQALAPIAGPCSIDSVNIKGPSQGTVGQSLTFQGLVIQSSGNSNKFCIPHQAKYKWTLGSAPQGAPNWSATGETVSFTPSVAGAYVISLETNVGSAKQDLTVTASGKQPPSQPPPQPQPSTGIQEFALILASSGGALHTFPGTLRVSAGGVRIFMASLDRTITVVLRREGAQAGVATVLVEQGKIATVEAELSQATYGLFDQASNSQLGQIEAK